MKKGFTLIELLAVILILGIIALIAIPTVNNILKESRRGAFSSTLTNIEKAIEEKCTTEQIKNQEITTMYTIEGGVITPSLDIKGELPDGVIYVSKDCEVSFTLSDNNFTGTKEVGEEIIIVDKGNTTIIYKEEILNGTDPVLSRGLIPVTIANDGTVTKADISTKWYSYEEKMWANAVILAPGGKIESDGKIKEESIESYFVWIPRFKYKLFNLGNYTEFIRATPPGTGVTIVDIIFENKDTELSNGTAVGEYLSHPAFGAFNNNGFWMGKFETTGTSSNITIKPNQTSLRNMNVKTFFEASYNYKRNNESHLMKNTEWGAAAFLATSKYGINKKININNNKNYITGYSSIVETDDENYPGSGVGEEYNLPYNTEIGYKASSTGNITGVYDMSGGAYEYMASFVDGNLGTSGFTEDPTLTYGTKYFDKYNSTSTDKTYNYRILGDATGEMGPFYLNGGLLKNNWWIEGSYFVNSNYPWFDRGGCYSDSYLAGQFGFSADVGENYDFVSFRMVLAN